MNLGGIHMGVLSFNILPNLSLWGVDELWWCSYGDLTFLNCFAHTYIRVTCWLFLFLPFCNYPKIINSGASNMGDMSDNIEKELAESIAWN